jgi:hypothetical protein
MDKDFQPRKRQPSDLSIYYLKPTILISHTTPAVLDKKYITVELKKEAINRPENFWETYRKDSIDNRNKKLLI